MKYEGGRGGKKAPYQLFPCNFYKHSPQDLMTFSFNGQHLPPLLIYKFLVNQQDFF